MTKELENVFVYKNRGSFSAEKILQKGFQINEYCEENGYLQAGSLSMSVPMSQSGSELQWIMDYCQKRGISKILVCGLHDIGRTPAEVQNTTNILCANGFQVEAAASGLTFVPKDIAQEQNEDIGMTMGGI